jgi:branched-chain amino acid aminotransferase
MTGKCIFNGKIINSENLTLDKLTRGFLYGDGIFETMRSQEYKIFRFPDYLERLLNSVKSVNLSLPFSPDEIQMQIENFLRLLKIPDTYIRLTLWRKQPDSFDPLTEMGSNYLVTVRPLVKIPTVLYKKGISCMIEKKFRKNEFSPISHIKSLSFLENVLYRQQAHLSETKETILLNTSGFLAEASVSNIFFIKNNIIFTPSVSCGIVPGIMRKTVLEITKDLGIEIKQGKYKSSEIKKADEVFLTNTLIEVLPVTKIDDVRINNGKIGKLTKLISKEIIKRYFSKKCYNKKPIL